MVVSSTYATEFINALWLIIPMSLPSTEELCTRHPYKIENCIRSYTLFVVGNICRLLSHLTSSCRPRMSHHYMKQEFGILLGLPRYALHQLNTASTGSEHCRRHALIPPMDDRSESCSGRLQSGRRARPCSVHNPTVANECTRTSSCTIGCTVRSLRHREYKFPSERWSPEQ